MPWLLVLSLVLLLAPWAAQAGYHFQTIDVGFSGASNTVVTGLTPHGLAVGIYQDAGHVDQGFARTRQGRTTMLLNVLPQAVTSDGVLVGWFQGTSGTTQGFLLQAGTFTPIRGVFVRGQGWAPLVEPRDVNAAGLVVGTFRSQVDGAVHGFLYESATRTWTQVDVPGGTETTLVGVNALGQQVGSYLDGGGQRVLFRREGTTVDVLTIPGLADVDLVGLTDDGVLAGNTPDAGFVLAAGVVTLIAVPTAQRTQLFGVRGDGTVYGRFVDSAGAAHGFIAVPEGAPPAVEPEPGMAATPGFEMPDSE